MKNDALNVAWRDISDLNTDDRYQVMRPLTPEEYDALRASISKHGVNQPIDIDDQDRILDGHHRASICRELGIERVQVIVRRTLVTDAQKIDFAKTQNYDRRHATKDERDAYMRDLRAQGLTYQQIADKVGVSVDTAHRTARDVVISEIGNDRGQTRPATYQRQPDPEPSPDWTAKEQTVPQFQPARPLPLTAANHAPSFDPDYDGDEWNTPVNVIALARHVFGGGIDLDPATNEIAQASIRAARFYTKADNGLTKPWHGNVWLNPPYSMPLISQFIERALTAHVEGEIESAIILTNNSSETRWFQALLRKDLVCFPAGRLEFWRGNHQSFGARQGQAIFYLGANSRKFASVFSAIGPVMRTV